MESSQSSDALEYQQYKPYDFSKTLSKYLLQDIEMNGTPEIFKFKSGQSA